MCYHLIGDLDGNFYGFQHEPRIEIVVGIPVTVIVEVSGVVDYRTRDVAVESDKGIAGVTDQQHVVGGGVQPGYQRLSVISGEVPESAQSRRIQRRCRARVFGIRGKVVAGSVQYFKDRHRLFAQQFLIDRVFGIRQVGGIQHIEFRSVGIEVNQIDGQSVSIGFQRVHRISIQAVLARHIEAVQRPGQHFYFQSYDLTVEYGVNVGIAVRACRRAVVDVEFGISGISAVRVIEMPLEGTDFGGGFFLYLISVDLCEVELDVILSEVPGYKGFAQFVAAHIADFVGIIGFEHQIDVRIDVYRIGYGDFFGYAVGSHDVDELVRVDFPVQYLNAHVFAVCSHHAVADNDVDDVNAAVDRDVFPIGRSEGIRTVVAYGDLIGENAVVDIQALESGGIDKGQPRVGSFGAALPPDAGISGRVEISAGNDVGVQ